MSAEIVSRNQYRKAKQKAEKEEQTAANLLRYGRNRAEKRAQQMRRRNYAQIWMAGVWTSMWLTVAVEQRRTAAVHPRRLGAPFPKSPGVLRD